MNVGSPVSTSPPMLINGVICPDMSYPESTGERLSVLQLFFVLLAGNPSATYLKVVVRC